MEYIFMLINLRLNIILHSRIFSVCSKREILLQSMTSTYANVSSTTKEIIQKKTFIAKYRKF